MKEFWIDVEHVFVWDYVLFTEKRCSIFLRKKNIQAEDVCLFQIVLLYMPSFISVLHQFKTEMRHYFEALQRQFRKPSGLRLSTTFWKPLSIYNRLCINQIKLWEDKKRLNEQCKQLFVNTRDQRSLSRSQWTSGERSRIIYRDHPWTATEVTISTHIQPPVIMWPTKSLFGVPAIQSRIWPIFFRWPLGPVPSVPVRRSIHASQLRLWINDHSVSPMLLLSNMMKLKLG